MLKYAGVEIGGIPDPDGRLVEQLRQWWHQDGIRDYTHPAHNVAGIDHLPIPAQPDVQPPKLNTLVWPNGASRWGEFHTFVTKSQLDAIYKAVDPVTPIFQKLEILPAADKDSLGLNLKVAPMMYLLPPRVVCRHSGGELYLLSLVDKRFYWWQRVAAAPSAPATWAALLSELLTAVDEPTAAIEAVDSAYGTPDADRWNVGYKPLPLLIDAACRTVGLRLVLQIGGTDVVVRGAASAIGVLDTAWNVYKDEVMTGGRLTLEDLALGLPEKVRVVFPGDTPATEDYELQSGATTWEATYQGVVGAVAFVGADMPATAAAFDRTQYATAAAIDFYEWCNSPVDATFRGLAGWAPTGLEDRIEWVHERQRVVTRVYRLPSHDRNLYLGDAAAGGADVECVRVTSLSPTDGRYPGKIQDYDVEAKTWSDRSGGDCWVVGKNGRSLQLLRYEDAKSRGDLAADSKPVYAVWEGLGSGSSPAVPCKNLGWLRSGPRSNKAWKVSVVEALGECDCTTLQGGDSDPNGSIYAIYNATASAAAGAGVDVWDVTRNLVMCCGCASATITVTHASKLAQLTLTYKSCTDSSTQIITIDAECGSDGYVIFDVYAEDLCDPPAVAGDYACTSIVRIYAECVDPPTTACGCAGCVTSSAPFAFKADLSGFTNSAYNGTFWLESDGTACGFETKAACSGPTLVYDPDATPDPVWRLTIGGFVYEVARDSFNCNGTSTLSITAASGDAPATIDVTGVSQDAKACCTVTGTFNYSVSPNTVGDDAIPTGLSALNLTNGNGSIGATAACGTADPVTGDQGWEFRLRCEGDHYYASVYNKDLVSEQEVFPTFNPFGVVFQYTPRPNDCGEDGTLTTITISEP